MAPVLKVLLSVTTIALCLYGISVFGVSMWPVIFIAGSVFILASLALPILDGATILLARVMGVLSLVAFLLLLLASTIGGSSNMSESNQLVAVGLALMALFGCAFFFVKKSRTGT